jgi:DnaJ-class molecular chaperone
MNEQWQNEIQRRLAKERLARRILGVDENADTIAIKKAFWLLAMQYHPDKCPHDEETRKRFANMVNAYEFLAKGESKGWNPVEEDAPEEARIGKYLASEWGYFRWWRDNFDSAPGEIERHKPERKPTKNAPQSNPGDWW